MQKLKIGTRESPLALRQTEMVCAALHRFMPDLAIEVVKIRTSGEWNPALGETRLSESEGGKGQFSKELEAALLSGTIDCAVHSMKDMESVLPAGLIIPCVLKRANPHDALLANNGYKLSDLPIGARIGTSSMRRQAFLLNRRPDLDIVPLRGNVQTRIDKLRAGQVDATLLACAGLERLGLESHISEILPADIMLPSAGQGTIGIEICDNREDLLSIFDQINCPATLLCVTAERAALAALDGSCRTPVGAYATLDDGRMSLHLRVTSGDGRRDYAEEVKGALVENVQQAEALGTKLGRVLADIVPPEIIARPDQKRLSGA